MGTLYVFSVKAVTEARKKCVGMGWDWYGIGGCRVQCTRLFFSGHEPLLFTWQLPSISANAAGLRWGWGGTVLSLMFDCLMDKCADPTTR